MSMAAPAPACWKSRRERRRERPSRTQAGRERARRRLAGRKAPKPVYSGGVLSLSYAGQTVTLSVATQYVLPQFILTDDGGVGTDITVAPPPVTASLVSDTGASASDRITSNPTVGGSG